MSVPIVLVLIGMLTVALQQPTPTGVVQVVIVDDAGTPLSDAYVHLTSEAIAFNRGIRSGADGAARFDAVPAGTFTLNAQKPGHLARTFDVEHGTIVPITLLAGDRFDATMTLPRAGSITGTVLDAEGRPSRAVVRARQVGGRGMRATRSGADGTYRVDELEPGEYIVSALGPNAPLGRGATGGTLVYVHAPVYFHGTTSVNAATPVAVRAGGPAAGIDLRLQLRALARVEGVVIDAQGQPAPGAVLQLANIDDDGTGPLTVRTSTTGTFSTPVISGTYKLTAPHGTTLEVVASPGATTQITVALQRTVRVTGQLRMLGASGPAFATGAPVLLLIPQLSAPGPGGDVPVRVASTETRTLTADNVAPGEYRLRIAPALDGWMIESIAAVGRELVDGMLRVAPGEDISDLIATVSAPPTEIAGSVVDRSGAPVYRHRIVLVAADRAHWVRGSRRIAWAQPDTRGLFAVRGLPPGEYLLAAVEGAATGDIDLGLLEAAAAQAVRVTLARGGRVVQQLMIAR